ncbi:TIGR01777 family oxidoreductase [Hoyosella rhizosphaerae]|uniref:Epimerase n=1 Tax=Hoyosella rhizosphaerae TaxID=1755582 RepID=A0A916UGT8_9ACTN|nr:TIGR01777 family oxidoreductase [Hoyosella rhizosphaerae]MBN4927974.1 TIGR01777 family oxidoreductase [Hoyosella rhizosphaerae]GGC71371.1 epimerase [Hoyosella rhizosphaerae]
MRVVIAGSSGLIGTALVAGLRAENHEVLRLVRRKAQGPDEIQWSPSAALDPSVLDGCDAVVNLCGASIADKRWTGAYKQELRDSRIGPTEVLGEAVSQAHVPTLINASAVGFYGDTGDNKVGESSSSGEGFLADLCVEWEKASLRAANNNTRVVNIRTGIVLSKAGGMIPKLIPLYKLALGGRLGDGRQYFPWITLEDHIRAVKFLLESTTVDGPVNLTGPAPVTNAEFNRAFGKVVHRPSPWVVPGFALKALVGEFASTGILGGQRAIPAKLEDAGFTFEHHTIREALDATLTPGVGLNNE